MKNDDRVCFVKGQLVIASRRNLQMTLGLKFYRSVQFINLDIFHFITFVEKHLSLPYMAQSVSRFF